MFGRRRRGAAADAQDAGRAPIAKPLDDDALDDQALGDQALDDPTRRDRAADDRAGDDGEEFVDDLDEEDRAYEDQLLLAEIEERERAAATRPQGPWDAADAPAGDVDRLDLGGLLVPVPAETEVRVEVDPEGAVVAATLVRGPSSVQLTAFAAPRSEGIWVEVREEIAASLAGTGGRTEEVDGPYGPELRALVPTQAPDGRGIVLAPTRFVGVDGPRWFLRALYTGPAAVEADAAAPLEQAVRAVVVVRGPDPMAVKDPLPLRLPPQATPAAGGGAAAPDDGADDGGDDPDDVGDPLALPERGPEITESR